MTLRQRMEDARQEYRHWSLEQAPGPALRVTADPSPTRRHRPARRRVSFATAALVIGLLAAVTWAAWPDGSDSVQSAVSDAPPDLPASKVKDPTPPGAVALADGRIRLDPPGPFTDGQRVRVTELDRDFVARAGAPELLARQCAVVADDPQGPSEWCDPSPVLDVNDDRLAPEHDPTWLTVRVRRVVLTRTGARDCEDPAVTCRIVVAAPPGESDIASPVLRFTGSAASPTATADLDGSNGSVLLTLRGVEPHPSWTDVAATDPDLAARYPMEVVLCAFEVPQPPSDPSSDLTVGLPADDPGRHVPSPTCGSRQPLATLDMGDLSRPVPLEVPRWFAARGGWIDCGTGVCFLEVHRTLFERLDTGEIQLDGIDVPVRVTVEPRQVDRRLEQPGIRLLTPGPHRLGDELRLEASGLASESGAFAVCVDRRPPLDCTSLGEVYEPLSDGEHRVRLPAGILPPDRSDRYYLLFGNALDDRLLAVAALELVP